MKNDVLTSASEYIAYLLSNEGADLFTSEIEYIAQLGLEERKSAMEILLSASPIENFEVIPDDYEETQPHAVILSNATTE